MRTAMELASKTALLTGATGGLGRAIAKTLAARGVKLALSGRKAEALEALAAELPGEGHRTLPADLGEAGAAEKLAAEAGDEQSWKRRRLDADSEPDPRRAVG